MTPRVVYDTNVVVSAVLKAGSIPALLVNLALRGWLRPCLSPIILDEYETVLKRPKFGFDVRTVDAFLRDLRTAAVIVSPRSQIHAAPHEPDNRFLECAQAAQAQYLVTGNKRHSPFVSFGRTRIVSPSELARIVTTHP
jgi:putative PIN family toxin of toxin-antitoxin system